MDPFVEHHQSLITGTLSCFDRVIITGTLPDISYADAMTKYLSYYNILIYDYTK